MNNNLKERDWLAQARINKNLTQMELGKLAGVSGNAITQYEKGKRFPKPQVLQKICEALGIEVKNFYEN